MTQESRPILNTIFPFNLFGPFQGEIWWPQEAKKFKVLMVFWSEISVVGIYTKVSSL